MRTLQTIVNVTDSPEADVPRFLAQVIDKAWRAYMTELERCRNEFSTDAVHDVRVATRRLMSIIWLLHSVSPQSRLQKIIRALKEQLDAFDELRDTQVILKEIEKTIPDFAELELFRHRQLEREKSLLRKLPKKVRKFKLKGLTRRIHTARDHVLADGKKDMAYAILNAVDDTFVRAKRRLGSVDPAVPATIHRVRVAFKKFRYMVEIIHPLVAGFPRTYLKRMHAYQSLMGEVQDADVFLHSLQDFFNSDSRVNADSMRQYYERRLADAVSAYASQMDHLHKFWRSAPHQPFPWMTLYSTSRNDESTT